MHPPPSTPTPRRFLLPKRGSQTSSQTPSAAAASTPRFQSTPRFGVGSSAARPIGRKALSQEIEDVDEGGGDESDEVPREDEERVISSSLGEADGEIEAGGAKKQRPHDDIMEESQSQESLWGAHGDGEGEDIVKESTSPEERRVKRRRLSVSPAPTTSPPRLDLSAPLSPDEGISTPANDESNPWPDSDDGAHLLPEEGEDVDPTGRDVPAMQQPTFRSAPRFKPTEAEAIADGLPAAFSPQRRGIKYVPGGLAAELQGWLSDVKKWDEEGGGGMTTGQASFRVLAREVRDGERMYLVIGDTEGGETGVGFIFAGEGRLTGLGRRAEVARGSMVEVDGPVWEVELEGRRWTVACEWSVI